MGISRGRLEAIRKPTAIPRISMQTAGIHDFIWRAPCLLVGCLLLWGGNLLEVPVIGADLLQVQGKLDFHRRQSPANAGNQNVDGLPLSPQPFLYRLRPRRDGRAWPHKKPEPSSQAHCWNSS